MENYKQLTSFVILEATQSNGASSYPSPSARRSSTRLARAASNLNFENCDSVKKDIMEEDENYQFHDRPTRRTTRAALRAVEVVIPVKNGSTSSGSSISPSVDTTSGEASLCNTPATSVTTTPVESDSNQPRKRISASARAQELRASTFSLTSASTGQKRGAAALSADRTPTELSDAALARSLQLEEYERTGAKRQRLSVRGSRHISEIQNSKEDDDAMPTELHSLNGAGELAEHSLHHRGSRKSVQFKRAIPDTDESSLSDLDSIAARLVSELDDSGDEVLYQDSSDESVSDYASLLSDGDRVLPMPQRASTRGSGRARRRARNAPAFTAARQDPLPRGMSRRVRDDMVKPFRCSPLTTT
jgi:DNA repair protein RAD16